MIDRIAVDTNAVIDQARARRVTPPPLEEVVNVFVPLPVVGELFTGAYISTRRDENLSATELVIARWTVLAPDLDTARIYGRIRAQARLLHQIGQSLTNDLWIAALCVQYSLPLLTNDQGFDRVPGLEVIHW